MNRILFGSVLAITLWTSVIVTAIMTAPVNAEPPSCQSLSVYPRAENATAAIFPSYTLLSNYSAFENGATNRTVYYLNMWTVGVPDAANLLSYGEFYYYDGHGANVIIYECVNPALTRSTVILPPIPVFPIESLLPGLILGLAVLLIVYVGSIIMDAHIIFVRRRRKTVTCK